MVALTDWMAVTRHEYTCQHTFSCACLFREALLLFLCSVRGVTRRWILGALLCDLPSLPSKVRLYVFTYLRTSSSLVRLKSFLILEALLGPLKRGLSSSVSPGNSPGPAHNHNTPSHQTIELRSRLKQINGGVCFAHQTPE